MRKIVFVEFVCILLILSGCSRVYLNVYSEPEGAYITEDGTNKIVGIAPSHLVYYRDELEKNVNSKGCYVVKGVVARWVSGATARTGNLELCSPNILKDVYNYTVYRNPTAPNLGQDLQFAIQAKSLRAQQSQAAAAWSANYSTNTKCTSTMIGNTLHTNCY